MVAIEEGIAEDQRIADCQQWFYEPDLDFPVDRPGRYLLFQQAIIRVLADTTQHVGNSHCLRVGLPASRLVTGSGSEMKGERFTTRIPRCDIFRCSHPYWVQLHARHPESP